MALAGPNCYCGTVPPPPPPPHTPLQHSRPTLLTNTWIVRPDISDQPSHPGMYILNFWGEILPFLA